MTNINEGVTSERGKSATEALSSTLALASEQIKTLSLAPHLAGESLKVLVEQGNRNLGVQTKQHNKLVAKLDAVINATKAASTKLDAVQQAVQQLQEKQQAIANTDNHRRLFWDLCAVRSQGHELTRPQRKALYKIMLVKDKAYLNNRAPELNEQNYFGSNISAYDSMFQLSDQTLDILMEDYVDCFV